MSEFVGWDNYSDSSESDDESYKHHRNDLVKKYLSYSNNMISVFKF